MMRVSLLPFALALQLLHPCAVAVAVAARGGRRPANSYKPMIRFLEADGCRGRPHHMLVHSVSFAMDSAGSELVNARVEFTKNMKRISKLVAQLWRCVGGVSPSLCEYYTTWKWVSGCCQLVAAEGMFWTPLRKSIEPPIRCPFHTGVYDMRNGTVDLKVAGVMLGPAMYNCFWIVTFELYDEEGARNICLNATLEYRRVLRRWSGATKHPGGGGV